MDYAYGAFGGHDVTLQDLAEADERNFRMFSSALDLPGQARDWVSGATDAVKGWFGAHQDQIEMTHVPSTPSEVRALSRARNVVREPQLPGSPWRRTPSRKCTGRSTKIF